METSPFLFIGEIVIEPLTVLNHLPEFFRKIQILVDGKDQSGTNQIFKASDGKFNTNCKMSAFSNTSQNLENPLIKEE